MGLEVYATRVALRQIAKLRGARKTAYERFEDDLRGQGCKAMGYRLVGDKPLSSLCVKHLRGNDRALVAFLDGEAWVMLVGPHDEGNQAEDVYTQLYEALEVDVPSQPRTKPPCCDGDGTPPTLATDDVEGML